MRFVHLLSTKLDKRKKQYSKERGKKAPFIFFKKGERRVMKHCKTRHSLQQDIMKSQKNESTNREITCHFAYSRKKHYSKERGKKAPFIFLKKGRGGECSIALQNTTLASTRHNEKQKTRIN